MVYYKTTLRDLTEHDYDTVPVEVKAIVRGTMPFSKANHPDEFYIGFLQDQNHIMRFLARSDGSGMNEEVSFLKTASESGLVATIRGSYADIGVLRSHVEGSKISGVITVDSITLGDYTQEYLSYKYPVDPYVSKEHKARVKARHKLEDYRMDN